MTEQLSLTQIQFGQQYEGEKARRFADEVRRLQQRVNTMITEMNGVISSSSAGIAALTDALNLLSQTLAQLKLADLDDVADSPAVEGDALRFQAGQWIGVAPNGFSYLGDPGAFSLSAWDETLNAVVWVAPSSINHNDFGGLTIGDPHTQYMLRAQAGSAVVNFGAFPGSPDAQVAIIGQTGITAGSIVQAFIMPVTTVDHSIEEQMLEPLKVYAANIVPGTGFTIYAFADRDRLYGRFNVGWRWS